MAQKPVPNWPLTLPTTPESARSAGLEFGLDNAALLLSDVELAWSWRLTPIAQIMGDDEAAEAVIAAFDHAALEAFQGSGKWRYLVLAETA